VVHCVPRVGWYSVDSATVCTHIGWYSGTHVGWYSDTLSTRVGWYNADSATDRRPTGPSCGHAHNSVLCWAAAAAATKDRDTCYMMAADGQVLMVLCA